jgi:hypothetical protein
VLGLLSVLVAPVTGSCGLFGADDCTCTLEFRQYVVRVVDSAETPVVGLQPIVTVVRTGQEIDNRRYRLDDGYYTIISDAQRRAIDPDGELLRFSAVSDERSASADYVFDIPGPCGCHVNRVSGPDTVVLQ